MKKKLAITIDPELIPVARRYAHSAEMLLPALIEEYLTETTHRGDESFASCWRDKFQPNSPKNMATLLRVFERK